jgi:hypothetical protein
MSPVAKYFTAEFAENAEVLGARPIYRSFPGGTVGGGPPCPSAGRDACPTRFVDGHGGPSHPRKCSPPAQGDCVLRGEIFDLPSAD